MERHFDEALKILKEKILEMSGRVEEALSVAIQAFTQRREETAQRVIASDHAIDMLEIEIDEMCMRLLALHQPQAGDLRFIASAMKINNDLERMGDLAVNIAERTLDLLKTAPLASLPHLPQMCQAAQSMLKDSIDAFVRNDVALAQNVCERDDAVDKLNRRIFEQMFDMMRGDPRVIERSFEMILVAKNLEKIADHATNICEDVIYMVNGKVIKHHIADTADPVSE